MPSKQPVKNRNEHSTAFVVEKMRHQVAVQRFAFPFFDAAPKELEKFWEQRNTYNRAANADWSDAGPDNFSGRATCIVMDPNDPNLLYAGSAAGGLWKTENAGKLWFPCWPNSLNQNIGALAIDPDDCSHVICATGEGNFSTASCPGSGIYSSRDGGFTWRSLFFTPGKRRMTAAARDDMPRRVSSISISAVDPAIQRRRIAFGAISNDVQLTGGLFVDQGNSGFRFVEEWSTRPYNCYSVVYHPEEPNILYAAIEAGGTVNGIWLTRDGGKQWQHLSSGLPDGELCGRFSLAISQRNPKILYAFASTRAHKVLGVFRTSCGGACGAGKGHLCWEDIAGTEFKNEGQLAFNNAIAIHPDNDDYVICGAQGLHLTEDGGKTWRGISNAARASGPKKANPDYVHDDHHAVVIASRKSASKSKISTVVYTANDGGIAWSDDRQNRQIGEWNSEARGMNTVLFYAIGVSPQNARIYGGGAQDLGTMIAGVKQGVGLRKPSKLNPFTQVLSMDGGYLTFDDKVEELAFGTSFNVDSFCHDPGRSWSLGLLTNSWRLASPNVPKAERAVRGLTVLAIRPTTGRSKRQLILGTNRLWTSEDDGRSWKASFFQLDGAAISAIEISSANPDVIFVGSAIGGIFRSLDGGESWSADLSGPEIPNRVITQLETHPEKPEIVVATVATSGRRSAALSGGNKPFSRVFRSLNSGKTWIDIDKGLLPDVAYNGLAYESHHPFRIFVGGDAGPWVYGKDGEANEERWASIAGDMPSATIQDLIYHHKSRTLFAGTYGRGIWRLKVPEEFKIIPGNAKLNVEQLLPPIEGFFLDQSTPGPQTEDTRRGKQIRVRQRTQNPLLL